MHVPTPGRRNRSLAIAGVTALAAYAAAALAVLWRAAA